MFIGENQMSSKGNARVYSSPSLAFGFVYSYRVRVNWIEDGKKDSQVYDVIVRPGESSCQYLIGKGTDIKTPKEIVAASLAKLTTEDPKLTEPQKFCAVQNGVPLGAMTAPAKIEVNEQPVFLCCVRRTSSRRCNEDLEWC